MRVLFVGTLPPPEGEAAFRFGRQAAVQALAGDAVETHAPHPLSVAHKNVRLGPGALARHLREHAGSFDAVVLRVGNGLPFGARPPLLGRRHGIEVLVRALGRYSEASIFADPGIAAMEPLLEPAVGPLWVAMTRITVANELDRAVLVDRAGVAFAKITVLESEPSTNEMLAQWPASDSASLYSSVAAAIRTRSQSSGAASLLLASAKGSAHPSLKGGSIWLVRRVIGKSRGWVTKLLRP